MFLYSNLNKEINSAREILSKEKDNTYFSLILDEIEKGKIHISISFSKTLERIIYEAYWDLDNFIFSSCPTFLISIDSEGEAYNEKGDKLESKNLEFCHWSDEEKALFVALVSLEKKLGEKGDNSLEEFYKKILTEISPLLKLNKEELVKRKEARQEFINFMKEEKISLGKEEILDTNHINVSYVLEDYSDNNLRLELRLTTDKNLNIPIRNYSNFFQSYLNEHHFYWGKKQIKLDHSLFSSKDQDALGFLSTTYYANNEHQYYSVSSGIFLNLNSLIHFTNLIAGEEIIYKKKIYYVANDCQKASVSLDNSNKVHLSPDLITFNKLVYFINNDGLILFNDSIGVLERFKFPNKKVGRLYSFFLKKPKTNPNSISDLLAPYLLDANSTNADEGNLAIKLFIDINDDGHLSFRTDYFLFDEKKMEAELMQNAFYSTKIIRFKNELEALSIPKEGVIKEEGKILSFLQADLSKLKKTCKVFLSERLGRTKVSHLGSFQVHLERNIDWLAVDIKSKEYSKEELKAILDAYKEKKRFILLKDKAILLDDPEVSSLSKISKSLSLDSRLTKKELPLYEAFNLKNEKGKIELSYGDFIKKFIDDILSFEKKDIDLDPSILSILRPYQLVGVKWLRTLYDNKMGGILADDMGLGKTLETIAFISSINTNKPSLILAPKSVLYNWQSEFNKFSPKTRTIIIDGSKDERREIIHSIKDNESAVYITSYDSLRNDEDLYQNKNFEVLVVDEAQNIKNALALRSKAAKTIKGNFRLALTGTPIENSMADLWAIFDFLMPGFLRTFPIFKTTYILAGNQEEARASLSKRIAPFLLRRTKEEVLKELPPKTVERISIPMDEESRTFYLATLQEVKAKKAAIEKNEASLAKGSLSFSILPLLTKLREICVDPYSFFDGFSDKSAKLSYALDLIQNALSNGHKVLVFSAFVKVLNHFKALLKEENIPSYFIYGDVDAIKRQEMAKKYNEKDDVGVMLVSLKAGGTGLNLQGADIVIHLDPWWNLASEEQATDRAYRIGQKRPVTVYKLYSHKTIEEKVLALQDSKKELYDSLIHNSSSFLAGLSPRDFDFLFE